MQHIQNTLKIKTIYSILIISGITGCGIPEKNDIYKEFPKGTSLSKELIKKADQIAPFESDIILVYNFTNNAEYYNPHLLFFNKELKLYSAAYFASERIESIHNGQINAYLNENRESRMSVFQSDVPKNYSLNHISKKDNGSGRMGNKIIEKIIINKDFSLSLAVRASESSYSFPSEPENNKLNLIDDFPIKDTLNFQLIELNLDYKNQKISSRTIQKKGKTWDHMVVIEKVVIDDFYDELFKKFKTLHNTVYGK